MNEEILRKLSLWEGKGIEIGVLRGGITNTNYLVEAGGQRYVAKFGHEKNELLGLNRAREIYNADVAHQSGIG